MAAPAPLSEPGTEKETWYNTDYARTRNLIERTFGIWKQRFAVLKCLQTELSTAKQIMTACAVLHNIATVNNIPLETENDQHEENASDIDIDGGDDVGPRGAWRAHYIQQHFQATH